MSTDFKRVFKLLLIYLLWIISEAAAQSESSEESGSDDDEFKGSNKIGEDKPVNDVLEKAKKEFKVTFNTVLLTQ